MTRDYPEGAEQAKIITASDPPSAITYDVVDTSSVGAMEQVAAKLAPSYCGRSPLGELLRAALK